MPGRLTIPNISRTWSASIHIICTPKLCGREAKHHTIPARCLGDSAVHQVKLGADLLETSEFPGNGRYAHNAGYQNIKQTRRAAAATARERTCDIMMKVPILVKIPKNMLNKIAQGVEVTMTAKTNAWAPRQIIQTTMGPFTIESHKEEVELIITFKRDKRRRVR